MPPAPGLNLLHVRFPTEVAWVLTAPLLLARTLAGDLAFRLQAESLMPGIARRRPEPNPAMATLSQSFRTHRFLPMQTGKNTTSGCIPAGIVTRHRPTPASMIAWQKRKKMILLDQAETEENESFRSAEEESFQDGVETRSRIAATIRRKSRHFRTSPENARWTFVHGAASPRLCHSHLFALRPQRIAALQRSRASRGVKGPTGGRQSLAAVRATWENDTARDRLPVDTTSDAPASLCHVVGITQVSQPSGGSCRS